MWKPDTYKSVRGERSCSMHSNLSILFACSQKQCQNPRIFKKSKDQVQALSPCTSHMVLTSFLPCAPKNTQPWYSSLRVEADLWRKPFLSESFKDFLTTDHIFCTLKVLKGFIFELLAYGSQKRPNSRNSADGLANLSYASWDFHYLQIWWSHIHSSMDHNPFSFGKDSEGTGFGLTWQFCTQDQAKPGTIPNQPVKRSEQCHKEAFTKEQSRNDRCMYISMDESITGLYTHLKQKFLNSFFPFRFSKGQCENSCLLNWRQGEMQGRWWCGIMRLQIRQQ